MFSTKKKILSKILKKKFFLGWLTSIKFRINRLLHERLIFRFASKEDIFTSIWRSNYWGSGESLSGPGSTLAYTEEIRNKIPNLFQEYKIKMVFDAPCGDVHWMQYVIKNNDFSYIGGDIVGELVSANKVKFKNQRIDFIKFDMTTDVFPKADVWLCRAIFFHLSNRDIYLSLKQFVSSDIKYILTTNHVTGEGHINQDISTGDWRLLNLLLPPFNFPSQSLWEVNDYIEPHAPATLTLWTKDQIEGILPRLGKMYQ